METIQAEHGTSSDHSDYRRPVEKPAIDPYPGRKTHERIFDTQEGLSEKFKRYAAKAYATEGFDIGSGPDSDTLGGIGPLKPESAREAALFAVEEYNKIKN